MQVLSEADSAAHFERILVSAVPGGRGLETGLDPQGVAETVGASDGQVSQHVEVDLITGRSNCLAGVSSSLVGGVPIALSPPNIVLRQGPGDA